MTRRFARKHTLFTFKMILILLMLNLSTVFLFGQTTAAGDTFIGYDSGFEEGASPEEMISAGLDSSLGASSKPVDASVIVLPVGTNSNKDAAGASTKNDTASAGGSSSVPDNLQSGAGGQGVPSDPQHVQSAQDKPNSETDSEEIPVFGQDSGADATVLLQAELDKVYRHEGEKVAYLTFDDGPIPSLTSAILDILKEENVKATFFMIGTNAEHYPDLVKRQYEEGHGIGNHTYSHVFKHIYSSPENFTDELIHNEQVLQSILGEDKTFRLTRFPGGSFGKALAPYREAANEAGFLYVDWNSLNGDAETRKIRPAKRLVERLKETVTGQSGLVVLMHDAPNKQTTVEALPEIIQYLRSENYRFELLPGSR